MSVIRVVIRGIKVIIYKFMRVSKTLQDNMLILGLELSGLS